MLGRLLLALRAPLAGAAARPGRTQQNFFAAQEGVFGVVVLCTLRGQDSTRTLDDRLLGDDPGGGAQRSGVKTSC